MLDRRGVDLSAYIFNQGLLQVTIIARHAHFDQFVAFERYLDLADDSRCQAGVADHHHRVQMMGLRLEGLAFDGGKRIHANADTNCRGSASITAAGREIANRWNAR